MGYIVTPIAVEIAQVQTALGSKNKRLLATLLKEFAADFEQIDELDEDEDEDDEDDEDKPPDELPSIKEVLRHLIMGEPYDTRVGFKYGYALEYLCHHFGEFLPNQYWSAMRWEWTETVDRALKAAKVPAKALRIADHLLTRGAPASIPAINDFPSIGYLKNSEVLTAERALAAVKLASIKDAQVREALAEVLSWLRTCIDRKCDLVCFYC